MTKFLKPITMIVLMFALLSACGAPASPTVTSEAEPQSTPVAEPAGTETVAVADVDQCVTCHTDKQRLIDTAKPEENVEGESKGVG